MALWSTKAAISLKRVQIEKSYYGEPIGTHLCSFEWYHPRLPTASPSPILGVQTPPKTPMTIISGTGKPMNFKFGQYIQRVHPNKSPLKISEKREGGRIQGLPQFFGYSLLSQEREKLLISNLASTFRGSVRTKAH